MLTDFLSYSDNPLWLVLVVIVSTFALEDLAIIGTAFLAANGKISPEVAFAATFAGIFIGDGFLYFLGRIAHLVPWLARRFHAPLIQRQVIPLQRAPWHQLALVRCMPGLRTFGYIACGLAKVPISTFVIANVISIFIWALTLFSIAYFLGKQYADLLHDWLWVLLPIALILFVLGQRKLRQKIEQENV